MAVVSKERKLAGGDYSAPANWRRNLGTIESDGEECINTFIGKDRVDRILEEDRRRLNFERDQDVYPRDGSRQLDEIEEKIGNLLGLSSENVVAFTYGMTALTCAIEAAYPTTGTLVLHAHDEYQQTKNFIVEELSPRGVRNISVDSTSIDNIRQSINGSRPDIIVLETVSNGPNIPVLDIDAFFSIEAFKDPEYRPIIIFDNTLPTSTLIPPERLLGMGDHSVIVVESGMKAISRNQGSIGIAYTNGSDLLLKLRRIRRRRGELPPEAQQEKLNSVVHGDRDRFDRRNIKVISNALKLARACSEAEVDGGLFTVKYPNLDGHPNSSYSNGNFPKGASPLFFIEINDPTKIPSRGGRPAQYELVDILVDNPIIAELTQVGHSFGLSQTTIFPDGHNAIVRVSPGSESRAKIERLKDAFRETLEGLNELSRD